MPEELKLCPFCGSKAKLWNKSNNSHTHIYVSCTNMMCYMEVKTTDQQSEEAAIQAWNFRNPPFDKFMEEMKAFVYCATLWDNDDGFIELMNGDEFQASLINMKENFFPD